MPCLKSSIAFAVLSLIIPPSLTLSNLKGRAVRIYAVAKLDVVTDPAMREAIGHMTQFICKNLYRDAQAGNNPPLRNQSAIALLDLESLSFGEPALTGDKGIVSVVTPEYFETIRTVATRHLSYPWSEFVRFDKAFNERIAKLTRR